MVLIFMLGGVVADVMADDNAVDELTTDAAVDDVVFLDFVADEMVFVDVVEVVMCVVVVVWTFGDIKHAAGGLLVGLEMSVTFSYNNFLCNMPVNLHVGRRSNAI